MLKRVLLFVPVLFLAPACEHAAPPPDGGDRTHATSPVATARTTAVPFTVVGLGHMPGYGRVLVEIQTPEGGHFELMSHARADSVFLHVRDVGDDASTWTVAGHYLDADTFESFIGVSARDACRLTEDLPSGRTRLHTASGLVIDDPSRADLLAHTNRNAAADALSLMMGGVVDRDGVRMSYLATALEQYLGYAPDMPSGRFNIQKLICGLAAMAAALLPYAPHWVGPVATGLGLTCGALLFLEALELTDNEYGCESDWNCDGIPDSEDPPDGDDDDPLDFPCTHCPRMP